MVAGIGARRRVAYVRRGHNKVVKAERALDYPSPESQHDEYAGNGHEGPPYRLQSNPMVLIGWELFGRRERR